MLYSQFHHRCTLQYLPHLHPLKETVSCDRFQTFLQKFTELGLSKGRGWFKLFRSADDFVMQKSIFISFNASLGWPNNGLTDAAVSVDWRYRKKNFDIMCSLYY